jgi:hypothetical protein
MIRATRVAMELRQLLQLLDDWLATGHEQIGPLFWQYVRPYGEVTLDLDRRLTIGAGVRAGVQRGGGRVVTGIS